MLFEATTVIMLNYKTSSQHFNFFACAMNLSFVNTHQYSNLVEESEITWTAHNVFCGL